MTSTLLTLFDRGLAMAAGAALVALLAAVTAGIVSRAAGAPFVWTDEGASYLMVWLSMLGWMIATRRGAHIRVGVLFDRLPGPARSAAGGAFLIGIACVGLVVAWEGLHLAQSNTDVMAITLPIATAWLYAPLVPAGLTMALQAAVDLTALLRGRAPDLRDRSVPL